MASKELIGGVRQGTAKPVNRRRISVWAQPNDVMARGTSTVNAAYTKLGGVLDDVSLQMTFCNSAKMNAVIWDFDFLPGGKDAEKDKWLADVKSGLGAVKIQVLAGYELMRLDPAKRPALPTQLPGEETAAFAARTKRARADQVRFDAKSGSFNGFNDWLNASIAGGETPKMDSFVTSLQTFFEGHCKGYDGISFDIEGLGPTGSNTVAQMAKAVSTFYGKVADAIWPKVVGIAAGALVSATDAFNDYATGGPPTAPSRSQRAIAGALVQPYEMAVNHPNLIVRPMMYDGQPAFSKTKGAPRDPVEGMLQWQRDMCVYALVTCNGGKGIANGSFQVGIKTNSQGGTGLGGVTTEARILAHATECRTHKSRRTAALPAGRDPDIPDDVGIIFFPGLSGVTTYPNIDGALNPTGPAAGLVGTPIQVPRIV
jgi:hypothetical protein